MFSKIRLLSQNSQFCRDALFFFFFFFLLIRSKVKIHHISEAGVSFEIQFGLWIKNMSGEHIFLHMAANYRLNCQKMWNSASALPLCHDCQIAEVLLPLFRSAIEVTLLSFCLPWLPKMCSSASWVPLYVLMQWRISPLERRGILILRQKSKPPSNWFHCKSSSKYFLIYSMSLFKVCCGKHVEKLLNSIYNELTFRANGYR